MAKVGFDKHTASRNVSQDTWSWRARLPCESGGEAEEQYLRRRELPRSLTELILAGGELDG
jgi:hypothetical protein